MANRSMRDVMQRPMGMPAPVAQTRAPVPAAAGQATMGGLYAPQTAALPKPAPMLTTTTAPQPIARPVLPAAPTPGATGPGTANPGTLVQIGMPPANPQMRR